MSRSAKKGPYVDPRVLKKVLAQKATGEKSAIKVWIRSCQIPPEFVGHTFLIHNGKIFKEVFISETMVGHRLGEYQKVEGERRLGACQLHIGSH